MTATRTMAEEMLVKRACSPQLSQEKHIDHTVTTQWLHMSVYPFAPSTRLLRRPSRNLPMSPRCQVQWLHPVARSMVRQRRRHTYTATRRYPANAQTHRHTARHGTDTRTYPTRGGLVPCVCGAAHERPTIVRCISNHVRSDGTRTPHMQQADRHVQPTVMS